AHWIFGRLLFLSGIANCFLGLYFFAFLGYPVATVAYVLLYGALGLVAIAFIAGELSLGQSHHKEDKTTREMTMVSI
ncbi:hypothetical protein HDU91_007010, partial [Kappamyces sp. JEL0680]